MDRHQQPARVQAVVARQAYACEQPSGTAARLPSVLCQGVCGNQTLRTQRVIRPGDQLHCCQLTVIQRQMRVCLLLAHICNTDQTLQPACQTRAAQDKAGQRARTLRLKAKERGRLSSGQRPDPHSSARHQAGLVHCLPSDHMSESVARWTHASFMMTVTHMLHPLARIWPSTRLCLPGQASLSAGSIRGCISLPLPRITVAVSRPSDGLSAGPGKGNRNLRAVHWAGEH